MGSAESENKSKPIVACTLARDVEDFALLIEEMESELGESWGDLDFDDAAEFFTQPEAAELEFIALALDDADRARMTDVCDLIQIAKDSDIRVILVTKALSPAVLHQLLRAGADDFLPYPLPEGALREAIERMRAPEPAPAAPAVADPAAGEGLLERSAPRNGSVFVSHGLAGGTGASTFAANLAWELCNIAKNEAPRVCIIDLDLQFGAISTYLDLPRRDGIFEMWADTEAVDFEAFRQALLTFEDKLHVLTAPSDILPLDMIGPEDVTTIINRAKAQFDYVVVDMPSTVVQWTETVLDLADVYFALIELDMRSAQNTLRMVRALKSEDLPYDKLRYVLNRAPGFTDLSGRSRIKRMAESLDIDLEVQLPDGGKAVTQACDHGLPLAMTAGKNALRKEIQKLAKSIHEVAVAANVAA
ncbi:pilus assembly protein CpaE [Brevirhabdus pacifica]|uniref:Pilus assembly protein CpaE n=1 Tax=Brevirhabdus pacifica TaxID=1267768 RepID=A0A1U7DH96_9RHOB|nr:cellulose synthase operon protein YhjQ/BcsQ [Brevirhabdus pacifica]APX89374.1 pilus assembly protein CpaE [Brevirhabdus pacifica]OWU76601.1 pilus assembly protein CpaE [Loktanella sp. 22II-4b]PJJ85992.1 pilus assembly protein CpaE [Brevirhabdus pacifica]